MKPRLSPAGFSLVELLASITVLILIMGMVGALFTETSRVWKNSISRIRATEAGRFSYSRIEEFLSQSTLNTYWDYDNPTTPTSYQRQSELQFLSGPATAPEYGSIFTSGNRLVYTHALFFAAPLGKTSVSANLPLDQLLNGCGYFVEYCDDRDGVPGFLSPLVKAKWRFRLREWIQPSETFGLYAKTSGVPAYSGSTWIDLSTRSVNSIADNVIALVVSPRLSMLETSATPLTTDFIYNSRTSLVTDIRRHQLPPLVSLTLFILDEDSAARLEKQSVPGTPPPVITTALTGLFEKTSEMDNDTSTFGDRLSSAGLKYKTVVSAVTMRGSKWSQ